MNGMAPFNSTDSQQQNSSLLSSNYGMITNSSGGKPKSKTGRKPKSKTGRKPKSKTGRKPVRKSFSNRMKKKSSNMVRKVKKMFKIKGGATGLPARWYNNDAVGKTGEHTSNALASEYGEYKPSSLGVNSNLYPYSTYTGENPFTMIQDNTVGGATKRKSPKKSTKKKSVTRKSPKKSTKKKSVVRKSPKKSTKKKSVARKSSPKKKASQKK